MNINTFIKEVRNIANRIKIKYILAFVFLFLIFSCKETPEPTPGQHKNQAAVSEINGPSLIILGTLQDAGSPHIACKKDCCKNLFANPDKDRKVVCLGVIDPEHQKKYLFEATPDITIQMKTLKAYAAFSEQETPDGIFLTHAHTGHYTGLMYLGKEGLGANKVPVYAMPRMKSFLEENGPWSQLVNQDNISLTQMNNREKIVLTGNISVIPFRVPHRDEYSETVGYTIIGPDKRVLFIPDIDKWEKWEQKITEELLHVDYAFIDATFYDAAEVDHRDISEIPHPFISESMTLFKNLPSREKRKVYFIHFNHTNPVLNPESEQARQIIANGFNVATVYNQIKI